MSMRDGIYEIHDENSEGELCLPRTLSWARGGWDLDVYVAQWKGLTQDHEQIKP